MTSSEARTLAWVGMLLEYPNADFFQELPEMRAGISAELSRESPEAARILLDFLDSLEKSGELAAQESYVAVFDHDPAASLHMTWHRYGNDRSQGKAMAALNGLYRQAGLEPSGRSMPDYLPRMFEFMSVCEDWATEILLDGFGPEISALAKHVAQLDCPHGDILALALKPLQKQWPRLFRPRSGADPTARPMANPEAEMNLFEPRWKQA